MADHIHLPDGSNWPPPLDQETAEKLNCYESETVTLTRHEAWRLRSIVGAYDHLVDHPAGTEAAIRKLRLLRRALGRHRAP